MSEEKGGRKDFPQFIVDAVYVAQDGQCLKCGNPLARGFHRHHRDGDHSNIKVENLELRCAECHRATLGESAKKAFEEHKKQEKKILSDLNTMIEKAFGGELSGAHMERLQAAMVESLKVSRHVNEVDKGIEYPSASIFLAQKLAETEILKDTMMEGIKMGVSLVLNNVESMGLTRKAKGG